MILIQHIVNIAEERSYAINQDGALNILGIRYSDSRPNYFDDQILVFWKESYQWRGFEFQATTLPGIPSLLKPPNPHGTAVLVPGQYKRGYALGLHKGKYEALVQVAPVKVYRDPDLDAEYDLDEETIEEGYFGINIHRASMYAKVVGADSAGCQVIKERVDYDLFISICKSKKIYQNNRFTYTLVQL